MHETVDINHPPEIRAEAAAKATVAAFAASEGHAHPRVIELPKVFYCYQLLVVSGKNLCRLCKMFSS